MDALLTGLMGLGGWLWLSVAVLFLIGELMSNSTWLMWLAVGAGLTAVASFLVPGLPVQAELVVFAGASLASVYAGRRWFRPVLRLSPEAIGINSPAGRLVGSQAIAASAFSGGQGQVKHGDTVWQARDATGTDLPEGTTVDIIAVDGATLVVRAKAAVPLPATTASAS
jgi:inner membrane protein